LTMDKYLTKVRNPIPLGYVGFYTMY
jgi:hypothetical protein